MSSQRGVAPRWLAFAIAGAGLVSAPDALALDKQGSAHGGSAEEDPSGFGFSGTTSLGVSLFNPTYAARPDNTGHALFRYAAHADVDLIGSRLSIPLDVNMFTDRDRSGAGKLVPTELDFIGGVTTTWRAGPGAIEFGVRAETDRNVDRGSYSQTYMDARARYLLSLGDRLPELAHALDGNVTTNATLGVFAVNPTYAARPDNSGIALMRYGLHGEVSFLHSHAAVGLDGTTFTDRKHNPFTPSELDVTPEIVGRFDPFDVHLAYERDMPIVEPRALSASLSPHTQHFIYLIASWSFELSPDDKSEAAPPEAKPAPPRAPETRVTPETPRELPQQDEPGTPGAGDEEP
jgi:hypothetical protein